MLQKLAFSLVISQFNLNVISLFLLGDWRASFLETALHERLSEPPEPSTKLSVLCFLSSQNEGKFARSCNRRWDASLRELYVRGLVL